VLDTLHFYIFSSHCKRYCRQHGGHLAKINDAKENAWILKKVAKGKVKINNDMCYYKFNMKYIEICPFIIEKINYWYLIPVSLMICISYMRIVLVYV
jgi:isoleucyl-tRNA synthetase